MDWSTVGAVHVFHEGIVPGKLELGGGAIEIPARYDVQVIDFGIAKATEQRLTEKTIFTEQGQLIGTPEYMSPEQAKMPASGIDRRTDIYSLGMLLCELLSGALPFDSRSLHRAGL